MFNVMLDKLPYEWHGYHIDAYKRELDRALIKITSGAYSKEEIIHDVIHNMSQSGLRSIDYKSGRSKQLDTGVKLAVRTGAHQLAHKIKDNNFLESGENLIYVSRHIGARNTGHGHANHEAWQGQVYLPAKDTSASNAFTIAPQSWQVTIRFVVSTS